MMEAFCKNYYNKLFYYRFPYKCRGKHSFLFYGGLLLIWSNVIGGVAARAGAGGESSGDGVQDISGDGISTLRTVNGVIDYLHTLKRSQDETFRKIDWLTKAVEEKDHENYQFRLKFSRKVHTLESKVLYMEHTFTQKVEQIVQKKVDEMMSAADNRLRFSYNNYNSISSGSSSSLSNSRNSHGSSFTGDRDMNIQSHQPVASSSSSYNSNNIHPYSPYHPRYHQPPYHPSYNNFNNNQNRNWGFYEHPITQKRVRESQGNLFAYEPPTRDLPLISLVAATTASAIVPHSQQQQSYNNKPVFNSVNSGSSSVISSSDLNRTLMEATGAMEEKDEQHLPFVEETKKKFESYDMTLESLRENVTNLENELVRAMAYQIRENDNSEIHRLVMEARKDISGLNQKHEEMVHRIEHFTVEMEKAAAKREHLVNESFKEISSDMRKQITAVKAYAKKQVQNQTFTDPGNSQTPDKLRCAQTLLDELLAQIGKRKSHPSQVVHYDTFADQAGSEEQRGNERVGFYMSRRSADKPSTDQLIKELATQRRDITELKSEIGKLNISQILLMRTVDQETLKRTVRPRDCAEIRLLRNASSGVYSIFPKMNDISTEVYCDMQTDGGGWTVVQRRGAPIPLEILNGTRESFARNWSEYEKGFGSLHGDFWLGLSNIALLCQFGVQELRIDFTNWAGETRFATYQYFKIANASQFYRLNVRGYSGTAGDSLSRHGGMAFSTPDLDNDADPRRHCAKTYFSGWWFYACFESNLNGLYIKERDSNYTHHAFGTGIIWHHWMDNDYSLKSAEMKIRNRFI